MLELISLKIKNLASHPDSTFYFNNKLKVIVGINKDISPIEIKEMDNEEILNISDRPIPSIGSGKSTIIEGLNLALFAEPIRKKITIKELIQKGKTDSEVELICKNDWLGLSKIRIVRNFYSSKSKSSTVKIFETNKEGNETELSLLAEELNNRIINYYIGISKEDLINFFVIQKDRYTSFLLLSDSNKKEIISKFTGVNRYDYVNEKLDFKILKYQNDLISIDKEISKELGKIEVLNENLKGIPNEEDFKIIIKDKISKYKNEIENFNILIKSDEKSISSLENVIILIENNIGILNQRKIKWNTIKEENKYIKEYTILNSSIKNDSVLLSLDKEIQIIDKEILNKKNEIKELEETLENANEILNEKNKDLNKYKIEIEKFKVLKRNLIQCPKCNWKFNPSNNLSDEDINKDISLKENESNLINKELLEVKNDIKELEELKNILQNEVKKLDLQKTGIFSNKEKRIKEIDKLKLNLKLKIDRINNIYIYIQDSILDKEREIRQISKEINSSKYNITLNKDKIISTTERIKEEEKLSYSKIIEEKEKIKQSLKEVNNKIDNFSKDKNDIEKNIQIYKDAKVVFLNFKNYIYNKMIFNIEQIVNFYLQKFSDLNVEIKGQKLLADGKTQRDEINVIVKRNQKELNYFLMSSGEKIGIDLSFILTFQHILNTTCKSGGGFNSLELDEVLGSLDSYSLTKIVRTLNNLNKSIVLISHVPINIFEEEIDNTYIIKENDNSVIYKQNN